MIRDKLLILLVSLLTVFLALSFYPDRYSVTAQTDTSNFLTYTNTDNGFTIKYPYGWILNDSIVGFTLHSPDMNAKIVVLTSTNVPPDAIGIAKNTTLDKLVKSVFFPTEVFSLPEKE